MHALGQLGLQASTVSQEPCVSATSVAGSQILNMPAQCEESCGSELGTLPSVSWHCQLDAADMRL